MMNKLQERRIAEQKVNDKHNTYIQYADDIRVVEGYMEKIDILVANKSEAKTENEIAGFNTMIESMTKLAKDFIETRPWAEKYTYQEIVKKVQRYEDMINQIF